MLGKFWESVGGGLAERAIVAAPPALVFWLGGFLAWAQGRDGFAAAGRFLDRLGRQQPFAQVAVVVAVVAAAAFSGMIVQRLTSPVLRLLEGYWPRFASPVRRRLVAGAEERGRGARERFQRVASPVLAGIATAEQREEYVRLDLYLRRLPPSGRCLPTCIGNTLRASEVRPLAKYGLDAVVVWPHLWLLLPDTTRKELESARASLDASVAAGVWGLLFVAFTPLAVWVLPTGLGVAAVAWLLWTPARAETFADLVEATFDLYRLLLYSKLRWPLPANPNNERENGRKITTYLLRGLEGTSPTFTDG